MVRPNYWKLKESTWTEEEEADFEKRERARNYGMTWKEWCSFVEQHTGSEIWEFKYQYWLKNGFPPTREKSNIKIIVLKNDEHPNDLGSQYTPPGRGKSKK